VLFYFQIWPGTVGLLAIPGLIVLITNGALANLSIGIISARFRDVPPLIGSVVQIVFFVTPIFWKPELLKGKEYVTDLNPFFHLLEIVRAPMLGNVPSAKSWVAVLLITLFNIAITGAFFSRYRSRISYWV
jgi:ABC-2 type transport system permease protein/lipopolysaccharide transport system permease protein